MQNEQFTSNRKQAQQLQDTEIMLLNEQKKSSKLEEQKQQLESSENYYKTEIQSYKKNQNEMESQFKSQTRELLTLRLQNDRLVTTNKQVTEEKNHYEKQEEILREQVRNLSNTQQDKIFQQTLAITKLQNEAKNLREKNQKLESIQIQQKQSLQRSEESLREADKKLLNEKEINFKSQYEYELKINQTQQNVEDLQVEVSNNQRQIQEKERAYNDLNNHMIQASQKYRESFEKWEEAQKSLEKENDILKEEIDQLQFRVDNSNFGKGFENMRNIEELLQSGTFGPAQQQNLVEELLKERSNNKLLKNQVQYVAGEIKRKASIFQQQQDEYRNIVDINEQLQGSLSASSLDRKNLNNQIRQLESSNQKISRDLKIYKQRHEDLYSQVKMLLQETMQDQSLLALPYRNQTPIGRQSIGRRQSEAKTRSKSSRPPDIIDVNQVVTEQLVTFKNVDQLIDQNQKLLAVVRCLCEEKDVDMEDLRNNYEQQREQEKQELESSMLEIQNELHNNALSIQQLTKQKDLYKSLLNEMKQTLDQERQNNQSRNVLNSGAKYGNGISNQQTPVRTAQKQLQGGFTGAYSIARKINFGQSMQPVESPMIDPDYWRQQCETLKENLEQEQQNFKQEKQKLYSQEQNLQQMLNEIKIERDKLKFEKELIQSRFQSLESEKTYISQDYQSEQQKSKYYQMQLDSITLRYEELTRKSEEFQAQSANLQGQVLQLQSQITNLDKDKTQVNKNLEQVQNDKILIEVELKSMKQIEKVRVDSNEKDLQRFRDDLAKAQDSYIAEHNRFEAYRKEMEDQVKFVNIEKQEAIKKMETSYTQLKEQESKLNQIQIALQQELSKTQNLENQVKNYISKENALSDSQIMAMQSSERIQSLELERDILVDNKNELETQIRVLEEQIKLQEDDKNSVASHNQQLSQELNLLQDTFQNSQQYFHNEVNKLKGKKMGLQQKIKTFQSQLPSLQSAISNVRQNSISIKEFQQTHITQISSSLNQVFESLLITNKDFTNSAQNYNQLQSKYSQLEQLNKAQVQEISSLKNSINQNDKEIQRLLNVLSTSESDSQAQLQILNEKNQKLEEQLTKSQSETFQSSAILDTLQKLIKQSKEVAKTQQLKSSEQQGQTQGEGQGLDSIFLEIEKWEEAIAYVRTDRDALFAQVSKLQKEMQLWKGSSNALEDEIKKLKLAAQEQDKGKTQTRQYMDSIEFQQIQSKLESLNSFRESNAKLRHEVQDLTKQLENANEQIIQREQYNVQLDQNISSLQGQVSAKEKELSISQIQVRNWKKRVDQMITNMGSSGGMELQKFQEDNHRLQEDIQKQQDLLKKEKDQSTIFGKRIKDLEQELTQSSIKFQDLQKAFNTDKQQSDQTILELQNTTNSQKQDIQKGESKVKGIQNLVRMQEKIVKDQKAQMAILVAQKDNIQKQYDEIQNSTQKIQESYQAQQEQASKYQQRENELQNIILKVKEEKGSLQERITTLQNDLQKSAESSELQSTLQQAREALEKERIATIGKDQEISSLNFKISTIDYEYKELKEQVKNYQDDLNKQKSSMLQDNETIIKKFERQIEGLKEQLTKEAQRRQYYETKNKLNQMQNEQRLKQQELTQSKQVNIQQNNQQSVQQQGEQEQPKLKEQQVQQKQGVNQQNESKKRPFQLDSIVKSEQPFKRGNMQPQNYGSAQQQNQELQHSQIRTGDQRLEQKQIINKIDQSKNEMSLIEQRQNILETAKQAGINPLESVKSKDNQVVIDAQKSLQDAQVQMDQIRKSNELKQSQLTNVPQEATKTTEPQKAVVQDELKPQQQAIETTQSSQHPVVDNNTLQTTQQGKDEDKSIKKLDTSVNQAMQPIQTQVDISKEASSLKRQASLERQTVQKRRREIETQQKDQNYNQTVVDSPDFEREIATTGISNKKQKVEPNQDDMEIEIQKAVQNPIIQTQETTQQTNTQENQQDLLQNQGINQNMDITHHETKQANISNNQQSPSIEYSMGKNVQIDEQQQLQENVNKQENLNLQDSENIYQGDLQNEGVQQQQSQQDQNTNSLMQQDSGQDVSMQLSNINENLKNQIMSLEKGNIDLAQSMLDQNDDLLTEEQPDLIQVDKKQQQLDNEQERDKSLEDNKQDQSNEEPSNQESQQVIHQLDQELEDQQQEFKKIQSNQQDQQPVLEAQETDEQQLEDVSLGTEQAQLGQGQQVENVDTQIYTRDQQQDNLSAEAVKGTGQESLEIENKEQNNVLNAEEQEGVQKAEAEAEKISNLEQQIPNQSIQPDIMTDIANDSVNNRAKQQDVTMQTEQYVQHKPKSDEQQQTNEQHHQEIQQNESQNTKGSISQMQSQIVETNKQQDMFLDNQLQEAEVQRELKEFQQPGIADNKDLQQQGDQQKDSEQNQSQQDQRKANDEQKQDLDSRQQMFQQVTEQSSQQQITQSPSITPDVDQLQKETQEAIQKSEQQFEQIQEKMQQDTQQTPTQNLDLNNIDQSKLHVDVNQNDNLQNTNQQDKSDLFQQVEIQQEQAETTTQEQLQENIQLEQQQAQEQANQTNMHNQDKKEQQ